MTNRRKTLLGMLALWLITTSAEWLLSWYLSSIADSEAPNKWLESLLSILSILTGDFVLGFLVGALLFSAWDWPIIGRWIKKCRERFRNKELDNNLADECEEISRYLYDQAATIERIRSDRFWGDVDAENREKAWRDARSADAREEERIRREIGMRVQSILVQLEGRGMKMDLWGLSLGIHGLPAASYFFAEIASSLRQGDYLEKEFKLNMAGPPIRL